MFFILSVLAFLGNGALNDFEESLQKNERNIVLFYEDHKPNQRLINSLNYLRKKFNGHFNTIEVDISKSKEIKRKFNISNHPKFAYFYRKNFRFFYTGVLKTDDMVDFFENILIERKAVELRSSFDYFNFIANRSANLVVIEKKHFDKLNILTKSLSSVVNIGYIEDRKLVNSLNLTCNILVEGYSGETHIIEDLNEEVIFELSRPPYEVLYSQECFMQSSPDTIVLSVLYSINEPWHIEQINNVTKYIKKNHENIKIKILDIMKAPKYVSKHGIIRFSYPVYFMSSNNGLNWKLNANIPSSSDSVIDWINAALSGKIGNNQGLKRLFAGQFSDLVIRHDRDVVLFVAAPSMPGYKGMKEMAIKIANVFSICPHVDFYEFNPLTEIVPGLSIPKSDIPQYSIWPALKTPSGSAFKANYPTKVIIENLIKLFKSDISEELVNQVIKRAEPLTRAV